MNSAGGSNMNNLMMQMNSDMMMSGNDEEVSKTLFLGDLSVYCTEKDIRQLFRPFGVIESIRLKKGSANSTRLGYGFIQFSLREAAEQALNHLNGIMFLGRVMR
jgi:RNA recognition motif-containing protein